MGGGGGVVGVFFGLYSPTFIYFVSVPAMAVSG